MIINSVSTQVFDELFTTIECIGVERTIKTLQEAKSNSLLSKETNVEFVLDVVTQVTTVSRERILYGVERSDEKKIALALAIYFVKQEFGYTHKDLNRIFDKDKSNISKNIALVKQKPLKPKTAFDKKLDEHFKKIDFLIKEKTEKNGSN